MIEEEAITDISDATLLQRVACGDSHAFDTLYTRWSPMLYGLVCKVLDDPRDAEDALQDGFLHIWHKAATYDARRSSPTTWAYMIFRNKAIDRLRSRERRSRGMEKLIVEETHLADQPERTASHAGDGDTREIVRNALCEMPDEQREALTLAFFSGLTQTEIAERLKTPLGTVKARIRRGLLKLADILKGKL
jgi:RNA polymerase sigma-70 factor, ECF subfamily